MILAIRWNRAINVISGHLDDLRLCIESVGVEQQQPEEQQPLLLQLNFDLIPKFGSSKIWGNRPTDHHRRQKICQAPLLSSAAHAASPFTASSLNSLQHLRWSSNFYFPIVLPWQSGVEGLGFYLDGEFLVQGSMFIPFRQPLFRNLNILSSGQLR